MAEAHVCICLSDKLHVDNKLQLPKLQLEPTYQTHPTELRKSNTTVLYTQGPINLNQKYTPKIAQESQQSWIPTQQKEVLDTEITYTAYRH